MPRTAYRSFRDRQHDANSRGIPWELTYEEWLRIWIDSGHFRQRGRWAPDAYVMSRVNPDGPFAADNVKIIPWAAQASINAQRINAKWKQPASKRPEFSFNCADQAHTCADGDQLELLDLSAHYARLSEAYARLSEDYAALSAERARRWRVLS